MPAPIGPMGRLNGRHLDAKRRLRPRDYVADPFGFGERDVDPVLPPGGDQVSARIALRQHRLVLEIRSRRLRPGRILRAFGISRSVWSDTARGHRWAGETVLAAMHDLVTENTAVRDPDPASREMVERRLDDIGIIATMAYLRLRSATLTHDEQLALFGALSRIAVATARTFSTGPTRAHHRDDVEEPDVGAWLVEALRAVMQAGTDPEIDLHDQVADLLPWARLGAASVAAGVLVHDETDGDPLDEAAARAVLARIDAGRFDSPSREPATDF